MDFLSGILEVLASAARAIWPGVFGAVACAYLGSSMAGFPGMVVGAAVGALAGTWIGGILGLMPTRKMTSSPATDQMLYAVGAFILVAIGYFLLSAMVIIAVIAAVVGIAAFWVTN